MHIENEKNKTFTRHLKDTVPTGDNREQEKWPFPIVTPGDKC